MLFKHIKSHILYYICAIIIMGSGNVIYSFFPKIIGDFTDDLQFNILTESSIIKYSVILLGIGIGYGLLFGIGQYMNHRMGRRFEYNVRRQLFRHFTTLSEFYFSKNGVGKLLSYVMNDVTAVRELIANGLNQMINATFLLVSSIVLIALSNIPLHLLFVCMLPLLSVPFLVVYFGPRIRSGSREVQESLASMTESAEEQFGGIRVTKTFAAENVARSRFGKTVDRIRDNQLKLVKVTSMFQAMIPFVGAISIVIALSYGGYLTIHERVSLGDFVALTLYLRIIINPLQQIGNVINTIQRSRASLDRLNALLAVAPDIQEAENPVLMDTTSAGIDIRELSYTYPEAMEPSLHRLNFSIKPGQTVAIVGRTGSGKTTLVKLLLRVYDPPKGTIFAGGTDIRYLTLESLRTQIAYVPQDGFLFSTTLRDNIAFFHREASMNKVKEAAEKAEIYKQILDLPEQFDTKLGERGLTLSGGQRQRTSLARGIIKDAPILILDDSVSAVDAITESNIITNLRELRKGKTTILIAHRISAIKHADQIIVLDGGMIVEQGTHEKLLKADGYYASLHAIQEAGDSVG